MYKLKSLFFIMICCDPWIKERDITFDMYLSYIEGEGGGVKDFQCIAQNGALFVDLI